MKTLPFAVAVALVAALGCRSNNTQVLVEQEARMLEDEVYNLEAQLDRCCRERNALAQELADLRGQSAGAPGASYSPPPAETPPPRRTPGPANMPMLEPPTIELPEASDTPPDSLLPGHAPPTTPGDQSPAAPDDGSGAAVEGPPTQLAINRRLTGGLDRDGSDGDEGIMVMVEPRDEQGRLARSAGAVSVVVMDPSQPGEAARVARWDFQAHEFDEHLKSSTFGRGLQYELRWPGSPPTSHDLMLFVRYTNPDGTKLTTEAPLNIRLASDAARPGTSTAESPERSREPRSRLKSPDDGTPRELSTPDDDPPSRARRGLPSPRQARDDRPEWKPYR